MGQEKNLTEAERTAWQSMLMAHGRVIGRLDTDLIGESDMTLAEYEVLDNLADGDQRLRMNELADRARLSPSGLTRRFDALVRRGWVVRERCDDDRRGVYARITPEGPPGARPRGAVVLLRAPRARRRGLHGPGHDLGGGGQFVTAVRPGLTRSRPDRPTSAPPVGVGDRQPPVAAEGLLRHPDARR
jgi:DNA-binding MarR family transcriptional regulator